jgi:hypothetical protein
VRKAHSSHARSATHESALTPNRESGIKLSMISMRRKWLVSLVLLGVLSLAIRFYMMQASATYVPVTSDESITVLQAKHIAAGERPLFVMAQPYQFPVEAYLMSPVVNFMPRNALGARFQAFVIGILSLVAMVAIMFKAFRFSENWPALLLVLFPSAYLLNIQCGYPIPHYTSTFLFWWIAILLAMFIPEDLSIKSIAVLFATGLSCGLAFTNNMVSLSIVIPVAMMVCVKPCWKRLVVHTSTFAIGGFAGLLPYLIGVWSHPNAQAAVAGTRSMGSALDHLWSPMLTFTLPAALGISPGISPDSRVRVETGEQLMPIMGVIFAALLLIATLVTAYRIVKQLLAKEWRGFDIQAVFVGSSWLGLAMCLLSSRSGSADYRYLTPVAWGFPFIVLCVWRSCSGMMKIPLMALAVFLAVFNIVTAQLTIKAWKEPDFGSGVVHASDLDPALEFLAEKGITHCVASHWAAYRINFLADEKILCSQPYNERFHTWSVPYKDRVDASENVAYVLAENIRFLKPNMFESHLRTMKIKSKREVKGDFRVYYDFQQDYDGSGMLISDKGMTARASHNQELTHKLVDGDLWAGWTSDGLQEEGMWLEVNLSREYSLKRIVMFYGRFYHDHADKLKLEVLCAGEWQEVQYSQFHEMDKFRFKNNHPVYGGPSSGTLHFEPVLAKGFRLTILKPDKDHSWTVTGVDVYGPVDGEDKEEI